MDVNVKKNLTPGRKTKATDLSASIYGKVPPQAREIEEAVLGAILLEKDKLSDVMEILPKPECFYVNAHQVIYSAIQRLQDKKSEIDLLTVMEELRRTDELELIGGAYQLTKITQSVVTSSHVISHARVVMQKYIQRELIRIGGEIVSDSFEDKTDVFELMDKAEQDLFDIGNSYLKKDSESIKDILVRTLDEIEEARKNKDDLTGVPTGFPSLDEITGGWQKTDLIILAARPSVGKTAFALNLAVNAALNAKPMGVAVFSLEMGNTQLVKRLLSMVTEVKLESISRGKMEDYEMVQLTERMDKLVKAPLFLDDQAGLNIFELRAKCRRLKVKHDIQLVIIDYLQLMHGTNDSKNGNREQEISKISRELKGLAKELNIPIIALSQLSRAVETRSSEKGKIPQLSDLRESGAIEQDADMVMFIYRPEYHGVNSDENGETVKGETHINIAKHRNGRLDSVKLKAELEYQRFVELPSENDWGGGGHQSFSGLANTDDFGNSGVYTQGGPDNSSFKTLQSKANNFVDFDDEDNMGGNFKGFKPPPDDGDVPF
ncbi:replicative DNA helicase [Taibaiella sp. KBW10]|uniref:replicative DNA helicase n=1 Tax=Taibaiella sp. KBW10 TaxID=2153357 RepID=UPI000F5936F7|nr:replicative DNA helicase [Taibaiella sp. KBW10]RQO31083.1 replicative DNA helicase [Taibaiella sp. KBW10]